MIAVDTNLLVFAHRAAVPQHRRARRAIERVAGDPGGWGVSIATISEFWSIVTHPHGAGRPSTAAQASSFVRVLVEDAAMQIWGPRAGFAERLMQLAVDLGVVGVRVFDLQIGLMAFDNGAQEIWTHDDRFVRIPGLRVHDPL